MNAQQNFAARTKDEGGGGKNGEAGGGDPSPIAKMQGEKSAGSPSSKMQVRRLRGSGSYAALHVPYRPMVVHGERAEVGRIPRWVWVGPFFVAMMGQHVWPVRVVSG